MSKSPNKSGSGSGSDSDSSRGSRSPSPRMAPTPGHTLEHHDSRSNSPLPPSGQRSRSGTPHSVASQLQIADGARNPSHSRSASPHSNGSRSRSGTPAANAASERRSRSASGSPHSHRSRSGTPHSTARSGRSASRSRSPSAGSQGSRRSRSASRRRSVGSGSDGEGNDAASAAAADKRRRNVVSDSGSDADNRPPVVKKKKSALIDTDESSDEDGRAAAGPAPDAGALFGDADDISTDDDDDNADKEPSAPAAADSDARAADSDGGRRSPDSDRRSGDDARRRSRDSDGGRSSRDGRSDDDSDAEKRRTKEPEPEPEPIPERRIDVEIPRICADLGKDIHFVKLPNFLSVDTRPFDPETYEDEIDEEETLDEEGRQRIKLKVSNTMRWREHMNDDGQVVRESNTRIVKWSDGSMSLHLGNEIFDVYRQPLQGDHNHLFIRQGTGLQGQAVFRTKLTFRPHSTESFTHKKMTMSLADRSQKTSGIKILTQVGYDPDTDRMMNLKKEEEKLRQAMRAKSTATKPKRGSRAGDATAAGAFGEHDSDDEGAISIAAIKNKYKKNGGATGGAASAAAGASGAKSGAAIYSSDEEDSDLDTRRSKRVDKSKASKALRDSDEEDDDDEDEDVDSGSGSDGEEGGASGKPTPRGNQIESDED